MSGFSEPLPLRTTDEHSSILVSTQEDNTTSVQPTSSKSSAFSTRRAEVFRHVFPRPSPVHTTLNRKPTTRATKPEHHRVTLSSLRQSRPRVAFHRVLTSFFNYSTTRDNESDAASPQVGSAASSVRSRAGSLPDSLHNLEVISPGTFLFSSPSLRSIRDSRSNSTSGRPSFIENGTESRSLRRSLSETISIDNLSLFNDSILEPFVENVVTRSMSDVLHGAITPDELGGPILEEPNEDNPDTVENGAPPYQSQTAIPDTMFASLLLSYLDFQSWKTLRLTSRAWYLALNLVAPAKFPSSYSVPTEILQHIFRYLSPRDFNAARHTCRNWMRASLDKKLLVTILKRGGWWSSAEPDLHRRNSALFSGLGSIEANDEWFLSRRLARECSLSGAWSGNGLDARSSPKSIIETAQTNFADLANDYSSSISRGSTSLIFSTSICGRLLLVARETLIIVYELQGITLKPLTSIKCPRRVLSMSMDITAGRNAVAAVLEGRIGIVHELRFGRDRGTDSSIEIHVETDTHPCQTPAGTSTTTNRANEFESRVDAANPTSFRTNSSYISPTTEDRGCASFNSVNVQANYDAITLQGMDDHRTYDQSWINHTWNLSLRGAPTMSKDDSKSRSVGSCTGNIPIESGTSTFYRHLCSEDDPPRSVSICPERRCVAFGCSAGIELHWIDALTGQSLSRWFPLTAPSDYLYFLPPRPGFESAKRLRLISSAAHPDHQSTISRRLSPSRSVMSSFWGSYAFHGNSYRLGTPGLDHYCAVPLSDGYHILFMDPSSSRLFLGCDAPVGSPTKLLRKILLLPPKDNQIPRLYTAAADLTWGARVVVAFDNRIMLYSIPQDVLVLSKEEQNAESWDVYTTSQVSLADREEDHWLAWWSQRYPHDRPEDNSVWPLAIDGIEIGTLNGVCELAILTDPDITIWGFGLDSQAKTWQLRSHVGKISRSRRYVCRSGMVHRSHSEDEAGDVLMRDAEDIHTPESDASSLCGERTVGFDGNSSQIIVKRIPRALHMENDEWVDLLDVRGCDAWYDINGDVVTADSDREFRGWETALEEIDVSGFGCL